MSHASTCNKALDIASQVLNAVGLGILSFGGTPGSTPIKLLVGTSGATANFMVIYIELTKKDKPKISLIKNNRAIKNLIKIGTVDKLLKDSEEADTSQYYDKFKKNILPLANLISAASDGFTAYGTFKLAADIWTINDAGAVDTLAVTIGAINALSSLMWYNTHGNRNMSKYIPPLDKLVENNPTAYQVLGRASGLMTSANYALFTGSSISKTSLPLGILLGCCSMASNGSAYWRTFDKKDDSIDQKTLDALNALDDDALDALDALGAIDDQDDQDDQSSDKESMAFSLLMSSIIYIASVNNGWGTYDGCEEYLTDSGLPENIKTILLTLIAVGTSYATINFISSKNDLSCSSSCKSCCRFWRKDDDRKEYGTLESGKKDQKSTNKGYQEEASI